MRGFVTVAIAGLSMIVPEIAGAQPEQKAANSGPQSPVGRAELTESQPPVASRRGPADLCQELLAFVQRPAEERAAEGDSPPQVATAVEAPSQDEPSPQPEGGNDASQEASGMSGPVAPGGAGTPGPQVGAQDEPAPPASGQAAASGQERAAAPASQEAGAPGSAEAKQVAGPTQGSAAPPPTTNPNAAQVEKAQAAARDGDIGQCRTVAQEMRRAGISMPAPLLALAALDLKFFGAGQQP
jgi:hypothetical protein